jgi:Tat protein translocase TatC
MFHAILAKLFKSREDAARRFHEMRRRDAGATKQQPTHETDGSGAGEEAGAVRMDGGTVGAGTGGGDEVDATDADDDKPLAKPFLDHLEDFRKLIFRLVITLMVALMFCFIFNAYLLDLIQLPLKWANVEVPVLNEAGEQIDTRRARVDELVEVRSIRVTGTFMLTIRLAFICGAILTFPVLLLMMLNFIIPGLGHKARRLVLTLLGASMILLVFGLVFAFVGVLPRIMEYFFLFGSDRGIEVKWTIENYVKFSSRILIVFAVSFQLPLLVMSLVKMDVLSFSVMHRTRSFAIVGIALASALFTPPDVLTLALMACWVLNTGLMKFRCLFLWT